MLAVFHRHRPLINGSLLAAFCAVSVWGAWLFLAAGRTVEELGHLPHLSVLLAGMLLLCALGRRALAAIAVFSIGGFVTEAFCLATGWPFGHYEYTALGPQILGVPIAISISWAVLLVYISQMLVAFPLPRLAYAAVGAAWMTLLDLAVEPLLSGPVGWWRWLGDGPYYGVPLSNFAGWFVLSFILLLIAPRIQRANPWVRSIGLSIPLFAIVIGLLLGFHLVAVLSVGLLALHGAVAWLERNRTPAK